MKDDLKKENVLSSINSEWLVDNGKWAVRYLNINTMLARFNGSIDFHVNVFKQNIKRLNTKMQSEDLNRFEFYILRSMAFQGGELPKSQLCKTLWGDDSPEHTPKLAVHVSSLKKKIKAIGVSVESYDKKYNLVVDEKVS